MGICTGQRSTILEFLRSRKCYNLISFAFSLRASRSGEPTDTTSRSSLVHCFAIINVMFHSSAHPLPNRSTQKSTPQSAPSYSPSRSPSSSPSSSSAAPPPSSPYSPSPQSQSTPPTPSPSSPSSTTASPTATMSTTAPGASAASVFQSTLPRYCLRCF